jgi:osmotically-inducible protein OsmY
LKGLQEAIADGLETAHVERAALWRLETSAYAALQNVKCQFRQGTLLLIGDVPTYYHKQVAQEAVRTVPGIAEIVNNISVRWQARSVAPRRAK